MVDKGVIRGGSYSREELLFRVGYFSKKFRFSVHVGISHDGATELATDNMLQLVSRLKNALARNKQHSKQLGFAFKDGELL